MITIDVLSTLAKYGQLYAVRQSDGKKVVATRTVILGGTSVRWDIAEVPKQPVDYTQLSFYSAPVREYVPSYRTSELVQFTLQGLYSEWQPAPGSVADMTNYLVD